MRAPGPTVIKVMLVGLPVGLAVSIVIALILYYSGPEVRPSDSVGAKFASAVSQHDVERNLRVLSNLGPRRLNADADADAVVRARKFLQSSLGPNNLGFDPLLHRYQLGDQSCVSVVAELPGRGRASELVVIAARYTSESDGPGARAASGAAALVSIAKALVGTEHLRTILFVAYAAGQNPPWERDLSAVFPTRKDSVPVAVVDLDQLVFPARESGVWEAQIPIELRTTNQSIQEFFRKRESVRSGMSVEVRSGKGEAPAWPPQVTVSAAGSDPRDTPADDTPEVWDATRLTQTIIRLQRVVEALANPGGP